MKIQTTANLACPNCGHVQKVEMPVNACQHSYICINCKTKLKPKPGDCCVFCSYADIKCPPKQRESKSPVG
ncbi:MAG: GDCCVxC domain-containing (seleno)protein [bacterium]